VASVPGGRPLGQGGHRGRRRLRLPGMPASTTSMSSIRLFGAVTAVTGSGIFLSFLALHVLSRAERDGQADEQTPKPPTQVPPTHIEEAPWSASRRDPRSPSPESAMPVDADGLRLRRRSHTRALRGLRGWLRIQGYRPPIQTRRPMINVSCGHARPVRSGLASFLGDPLGLPGWDEEPSGPGRQESADGPTSEPGPVAPS
jgi:hypothetical protein